MDTTTTTTTATTTTTTTGQQAATATTTTTGQQATTTPQPSRIDEPSLDLARFRRERWQVVEDPEIELASEGLNSVHDSKPIPLLSFGVDILKTFEAVFPSHVVDYLVRCVNSRFEIRRKSFAPQQNVQDTNVLEFKKYIALRVLIENIRSVELSSVRLAWPVLRQQLEEKGIPLPMGITRFERISQALVLTRVELEHFIEGVSSAWLNAWWYELLRELCVDETIFDYEPRMEGRMRKDPEKESRPPKKKPRKQESDWTRFIKDEVGKSPIMHIRDKPHDGLMAYGLATKSSSTNAPYMLYIIPYLGTPKTIQEVLAQFLGLFPSNQHLHVILDARFASWNEAHLLSLLYPTKRFTISMKINSEKWLWDILLAGVPVRSWRAAYNPKTGFLASAKHNADSDFLLLSNAFRPAGMETVYRTPFDKSTALHLLDLPLACIQYLVAKAGGKPGEDTSEMVSFLTNIPVEEIESAEDDEAEENLETEDNEENTGNASASASTTPTEQVVQSPIPVVQSPIPVLNDRAVRAMKLEDLKKKLKEHGITPVRGRKKDVLKQALSVFCPSLAEQRKNTLLLAKLRRATHHSTATQHTYYRKNFNSEDLANRLFYRIENEEIVKVWTSKFVWSVIRLAIGNAWTIWQEETSDIRKYSQFRRVLAEKLLSLKDSK